MSMLLAFAPKLAIALDYYFSFDENLQWAQVKLCFSDPPASAIALMSARGAADIMHDVVAIHSDGSEQKLFFRRDELALPDRTPPCIRYRLALRHHARATAKRRALNANTELLDLDRALLRPENLHRWTDTRVHFDLAPTLAAAVPGTRLLDSAESSSFALLDRPVSWSGTIAIGKIHQTLIERGDLRARVAILGDLPPHQTAVLQAWVEGGIDTVMTLYGRFPLHDVQVIVVPQGRSSDPVPWGEVLRGGGDTVLLYVDTTRTLAELNANWVLVHELSHLTHPYLAGADSWLSEGIASYLQNVLRARASTLSETRAWQKLDAGFKRGRAQVNEDMTLADDTRAMLRQRQYMRVYWSGAALSLIGDVALRERSNGQISLDTVLQEIAKCCLPTRRRWRARELLQTMDAIAGFEIFIPLYQKYVLQPVFPDLAETYRTLGIRASDSDTALSNELGATRLRDEIMRQR